MKLVVVALAATGLSLSAAQAQDLRIGLASEPTSMDPHYHALSPNIGLHWHVFERLVSTDAKEALTPRLAESWKVLPDGITWEIKLRPNVKCPPCPTALARSPMRRAARS
jgi:peptide/nickel transport system substrate-binding protein